MTDEMNVEINNNENNNQKQCNCICCSEGFRDFLKIALGSFVGVFLALSFFAALHKPPMHQPCPFKNDRIMHPPIHKHFNQGPRADLRRGDTQRIKYEKRNFENGVPVRVEIEHNK